MIRSLLFFWGRRRDVWREQVDDSGRPHGVNIAHVVAALIYKKLGVELEHVGRAVWRDVH